MDLIKVVIYARSIRQPNKIFCIKQKKFCSHTGGVIVETFRPAFPFSAVSARLFCGFCAAFACTQKTLFQNKLFAETLPRKKANKGRTPRLRRSVFPVNWKKPHGNAGLALFYVEISLCDCLCQCGRFLLFV